MLTIDALRVRYGPLEALHGVSLGFAEGEVTAVLGRNGAGKSTLLRAVAGYLRASSGRVRWLDSDITRSSVGRRAAAGVMLIPDEGGVFRSLTVRENLDLFAAGRDLAPALEAFPDLSTLSRRRVALLSGGEQQMLALSRALLAPWRLLLVDELSHGLAPVLATRLYTVLGGLAAAMFGWVDSLEKGIDAERYRTRWTPRRPTGNWTDKNVALAERLISEGRMRPAGLRAYSSRR